MLLLRAMRPTIRPVLACALVLIAGCAADTDEGDAESSNEAVTAGDRRDPATAKGDRTPGSGEVWSRKITIHVSDADNAAWASIDNGNAGDEVWLDRSYDGGTNWQGHVGKTTIPSGRRGWRTMMYSVDDLSQHRIGAMRACGKAGDRQEIACSPWFRTTTNANNRIDAAATALMGKYDFGKGLWEVGWWRSANALTTMLDYFQVTGSTTYRYVIGNTFDRNKGDSFTNEFMDDTAWWALAWIRAYDLTHEKRYLDMARHDADYIWSFKDQKCNGGIWWSSEKKYKNAITNELFVKVAASIYNRTNDRTYLDRALDIYRWFEASGMVNGRLLVNDGLTQDGTCKNNNGVAWSYNQGVILGGLVELARATGDAKYLQRARALADASTTNTPVTANGITHDVCEEQADPCPNDGSAFKGIYLRNLGELDHALSDHPYRAYITRQADTNYQKNRNSLDQYGVKWAGPLGPSDSSRQHSVLDIFVAAAR